MILPDYPIENKDDDKLRRAPLAAKIAELIRGFQGKESFVVGIEAAWGSGKTSFINLILNELRGSDKIIFVHFNPWNFAGQNELIADFFTTLHGAIKNEKGVKDLSKTLRSYASKLQVSFSPSIPVPFFGSIGLGELWKKGGATLQEERIKIDRQLKSLSKKIVIVIDDIDRLDKDETRLIMKLVKMTANFPNTVFLLAYDRDHVAEKLKGEEWSGEEYLKKIIQVSFTLPKPDQQGLQKILFHDLDETIEGIYGKVELEGENQKRWNELVYAGFKDLFKTVRDIKRYISSLRLNWSIMGKDEINMIDFIAIEAIRVFAPRFYTGISSHQLLFTKTQSLYVGFNYHDDNAARKTSYDELLAEVPKEITNAIDKISKVLFPQVDGGHGSDWKQSWRKELRICSDEKFPIYFQLSIPDGAISEVEVTNLVKTLVNKGDFSENLLRFKKESRLRTLLSKLLDRLDKLDENEIKNLILTLWDLEKDIQDERSAVFDFDDVETQSSRLAYHSIKALSKEKRLTVIKELLAASKMLYPPTHFIAILDDAFKKKNQSIEDTLLSEAEIIELVSIVKESIKKAASSNSLPLDERLPFILYRWKEWENPEVVSAYIKNLISTRKGLLMFLQASVDRVLSTTGNYNRLNKQTIGGLYPIADVEALVAQITDEELKGVGEKEKEAVNLFRNPKRNDW